jgi:hypothetical protein
MKIISFCIFGDTKKYRKGLLSNIDIIKEKLPEYGIRIIVGNDVDEEYIKLLENYKSPHKIITIIKKDFTGHKLMIERFFGIDDIDTELIFSRDADSRITERDLWCMKDFENNKESFIHIIRDHKNHDQYIMGGMCGFKKVNGRFPLKIQDLSMRFKESFNDSQLYNQYGIDQLFLHLVYKMNLPRLIHSNYAIYSNEKRSLIPFDHKDSYDFIGNIVEFDENDEEVYLCKV